MSARSPTSPTRPRSGAWPGADRWSIGGSTGRWVATRTYAGATIELATPTLNALVAACRDLDRLTDPETKP